MFERTRRRLERRRLKDPDYAFVFEPDETGELVSLDCETTGLDPARHELIEVAARHEVSWCWVKGHSGHPENELVDRLASDQADRIAAGPDA